MTGATNVLCVLLPLRIVSVLNLREHHMARHRRAALHRKTTMALLKQAMRDAPQPPVTVTLTRIAPRALDCDNNQAGFKACRDSVAEWLGRDDADPCISWRYAQRRGHTAQYAAEVVVEWGSMSATFFHIVDEHVASNPVARAVQSAKLAAAIREFQLQLYYLADDTPQNDNLLAAAKVIAVALRLHEVTGLPSHEANVLKGALSCIEHATARGCKWRSVDAPAIDSGIDRAAALVNRCTAQQVRDAWRFVEALEVTA